MRNDWCDLRTVSPGLKAPARPVRRSNQIIIAVAACHLESGNRSEDATVRRFYYDTHSSLRAHLATFLDAYNFAKRLKSLRGLTPFERICQLWTEDPERFRLDPLHHMAGLNNCPVRN